MRAAIRTLILITTLAATATAARFTRDAVALSPGECTGYAQKAVELAQQAKAQKCGFAGLGWSTNPIDHRRECTRWGASSTTNERNNARLELLSMCSQCGDYAAKASQSGRDNIRYSCGFKGGEWNNQFQPHFDWCMGTHTEKQVPLLTAMQMGWTTEMYNVSYANIEQAKRDEAIKQCRAQLTDEQIATCQTYANKASEQAVWNFKNKCGGQGPRWTMDVDQHFAWCTSGFRVDPSGGLVKTAMKAEDDGRDAANQWCERWGDIPPAYGGVAPKSSNSPLVPEQSKGQSPFGGKNRQMDRAKAATQPPAVAAPRSKATPSIATTQPEKPAGGSSSAMDRLGGSSAAPASGGSYKSKDGAPTQTRSSGGAGSGGAGTPSESFGGPNLRMSPGGGSIKQDTFRGQVN